MARINLLDDESLPEATRAQVAATESAGGDATALRAFAQHPSLFESYFDFYYPMHNGGLLSAALKELVRLKIARLNDCFT